MRRDPAAEVFSMAIFPTLSPASASTWRVTRFELDVVGLVGIVDEASVVNGCNQEVDGFGGFQGLSHLSPGLCVGVQVSDATEKPFCISQSHARFCVVQHVYAMLPSSLYTL
jgi:hypothetical protein